MVGKAAGAGAWRGVLTPGSVDLIAMIVSDKNMEVT